MITTVHQAYLHPPAAGGPGHGIVTVIPNLIEQIGIAVPDGDTGKLKAAHAAWNALATDHAISNASKAINDLNGTISAIDSPEIGDLSEGLDDLATTADNLHTAITNLATDCDNLDSEHNSMRGLIKSILDQLVEAIEIQIAVDIFVTFVSAGAGTLLTVASVAKFAKNITDAAAAIRKVVTDSKIGQLFTKGAKAANDVEKSAATLDEIDARSEEVIDEEVKEAEAAESTPSVHDGKQGKHIDGHPNYIPGKSRLTADPNELAKKAGTGDPVGSVARGQPGFKERVDFQENIGDYVDPKTGVATPTTKGMIIYAKDGSIHIVPTRP